MADEKMKVTNRMSGQEFVNKHGAIDFVKSPKTGKIFFSAGSVHGYVSKKVVEKIDTITLDDIVYGEIQVDDTLIPTLMVKASNNVLRTLGA